MASDADSSAAPTGLSRGALAAFALAVAILVVCALTIRAIGKVPKMPVLWPARVRVNEDYRNIAMRRTLGHYRAIEEDDPMYRHADRQEGADIVFRDDEMDALGIGTAADERRLPDRRSNWYASRIYRDHSVTDLDSPYLYWQVDIYYYTGLRDSVPHVPEICQQVGGAKDLITESTTFTVAGVRKPWDVNVPFRRVTSWVARTGGVYRKRMEYYTFSVNDMPITDRIAVRRTLNSPFVRHMYFAKIQFGPFGNREVGDSDEADKAAEAFLQSLLPHVLEMLPGKADIQDLDKAPDANPPGAKPAP